MSVGGLLGDYQMGSTGGGNLMVKPGNFGHCQGDALRKFHPLDLQVDEEGVQTPPTNDIGSTVRAVGLVERHGAPKVK